MRESNNKRFEDIEASNNRAITPLEKHDENEVSEEKQKELDKEKKWEIENEIKKTQKELINAEKEIKAEKESAGEDKDD